MTSSFRLAAPSCSRGNLKPAQADHEENLVHDLIERYDSCQQRTPNYNDPGTH